MIFSKKAKCILEKLKKANEAGKPITLGDALENWGKDTAWRSLIDDGYIYILSTAVMVTARGLKYLEEE